MTYTPCGGCGADHPRQRCINCMHDFGGQTEPAVIPTWDQYYMQIAKVVATKSKDSTKVGAILVGPDGEIRLTAYNGLPRGVVDMQERRERRAKYEWACHAEANLIAFAAREGIRTKDCTVYSTHQSCAACTRTLIQAGISKLFYGSGNFAKNSAIPGEMITAEAMLREANIICARVD